MRVHLHIEELVLHGLPPPAGDSFAEELRQAVAVRVGQAGTLTSDIEHDVVDAGSFSWTSKSRRELTAGIASRVSRAVLP
jgi:hypothetical protein